MANIAKRLDDYAASPVPPTKRKSLLSVVMVLAGGAICVAALFGGASLSTGLTVQEGVVALMIGGIILAVLGGLVGSIGAQTGLSTGLLIRQSFGTQGCVLVSLALALTLIGWFGVQAGFFGKAIHAMHPSGGFFTTEWVATTWGGILMLTTAVYGYRALSWLSIVSVPLVLVLSAWGLLRATTDVDILEFQPMSPFSLAEGVTLVVGSFAVGAVVMPDITRYAQSRAHAWIAAVIGFLIINSTLFLAGMITATSTGSADLVAGMVALGMGVPALLILVFSQWTTNDNNLYSASLGIVGALPKLPKAPVVVVCGVIATVAGALGLADKLVPYLLLLGVVIPPIAGVLIADKVIRPSAQPEVAGVYWSSLLGWGFGIAAGVLLPFGAPALNAILVALLATVVLKSFGMRRSVGQRV